MHKQCIKNIWDFKKPKIKHSMLIGHHDDGGFRDVDFLAEFKSVKFIWIKNMLDSLIFTHILMSLIKF